LPICLTSPPLPRLIIKKMMENILNICRSFIY